MIYLNLFIAFLQVGMFSFGGAYGAIPLVRDVVMRYGWMSDEMLTYMVAVSESTPGSIMLNMATYVGNTQAGIGGALVASLAVVLPSFIIILLITVKMKSLLKKPYIQAILNGATPCIIGVILATGMYIMVENCASAASDYRMLLTVIIMTIGLSFIYFGSRKISKRSISPIGLITISAVVGMIVFGLI